MAVYVDPMMPTRKTLYWPYRSSCHLASDSRDELIEFARKIGLRDEWIQENSRLLHYDLTSAKRQKAVQLGAIELTHREFVAKFKEKKDVRKKRS